MSVSILFPAHGWAEQEARKMLRSTNYPPEKFFRVYLSVMAEHLQAISEGRQVVVLDRDGTVYKRFKLNGDLFEPYVPDPRPPEPPGDSSPTNDLSITLE